MNCLFDTNILVYYMESSLPPVGRDFVLHATEVRAFISVVTRMEFLGYPMPQTARTAAESVVDLYSEIRLSESIVDQVIAIRSMKKIKLPDAIIAATAVVHGLTLVSRNVKDFAGIAGLEVCNPFTLFDVGK